MKPSFYDNLLLNKYLSVMEEVKKTISDAEELLQKCEKEKILPFYLVSDSPEWNKVLEYTKKYPRTTDELKLPSFSEF